MLINPSRFNYAEYVFEKRSLEPERIDTGDYTEREYKTFLREIRFINRWIGDRTALRKTLLKEIAGLELSEFSVLDVGAGSGELLKEIALFARRTNRKAFLTGLDLNLLSAESIANEGKLFNEIHAVLGDALTLPFPENAFDFAICSLFTHHFTDENVTAILKEMKRVSQRRIFVIDLHRDSKAYFWYKLFCTVFRISELVRHDGLLSITKSFLPNELAEIGQSAGFQEVNVEQVFPARLVLTAR